MQTLGDMREHFLRVVKMSGACGVNRCRGCAQVGKCDKLLATMPVLPQAPAYCENRDEFAQLRSVQTV